GTYVVLALLVVLLRARIISLASRTPRIRGHLRTTGLAITPGVRTLFCLRVVQPSMLAFRRNQLNNFTDLFISAQNDPLLITFEEHIAARSCGSRTSGRRCSTCAPF
ncbi:hypothetical protein, partial [Streptomyces coelicoflavus]